MFKINPAPTFRAKVPLTVPGEDARAVVEFEFRHKGRTAFATWWDSIGERDDPAVLADVIVSWTGVIDDKGAEVPFSADVLAQVLDNYPASAFDILGAYRRALWESREKN